MRSQFKYLLFYAFILISLGRRCDAQSSNYYFTNYTLEDGLPSVFFNGITQDTLGYMWFATSFGLNKFDGHHFTVYQHNSGDSTSIGNSYIRTLYLDSKGSLWTGHTKGLSKYNPITDDFTNYLEGVYVRHIAEDQDHNLWLATNQGIVRFNENETEFYQRDEINPQSIPTNNTLSILVDSQEMIWFGTEEEGLCRLNPEDNSVRTYINEANNKFSLSDSTV